MTSSGRKILTVAGAGWLAALLPSLGHACAVCAGGDQNEWTGAFVAGTVMMLSLPPLILVGAGIAIYRATKTQEARIAARDAAAAHHGDAQGSARPSADPVPRTTRHLRPV